jgi:hypothetical protein
MIRKITKILYQNYKNVLRKINIKKNLKSNLAKPKKFRFSFISFKISKIILRHSSRVLIMIMSQDLIIYDYFQDLTLNSQLYLYLLYIYMV